MKTFVPVIYNLPNPIGFDAEVYSIQTKLAQISWLQAIFGIAHIQRRIKSEGESVSTQSEGYRGTEKYVVYYPQGRANGIDIDLSFDDTYSSRVFFLMAESDVDPSFDNWNWVQENVSISQSFSIIFHCNANNLELINQSTERLKTDILYVLNSCPKLKGVGFTEDMKKVWKEFTITPELNGISRYPNFCFRIDMICNYLAFPYNGAIGFQPPTDVLARSVIGWKVCKFSIVARNNPNPAITQTLGNGDIVPIEYEIDRDGYRLTIPYLTSVFGIEVLSRFIWIGRLYQGQYITNGILDVGSIGQLTDGDDIDIDVSVPLWSE